MAGEREKQRVFLVMDTGPCELRESSDSSAIDLVGLRQRRADGTGRIEWSSECLLSLPRGAPMFTVKTVATWLSSTGPFSPHLGVCGDSASDALDIPEFDSP